MLIENDILPGCFNSITLGSLNQDIHHLFADIVDVGKVLKDTAFQLFVFNGIKKLIDGVIVESLKRKGCFILTLCDRDPFRKGGEESHPPFY